MLHTYLSVSALFCVAITLNYIQQIKLKTRLYLNVLYSEYVSFKEKIGRFRSIKT